MDEILLYLSLKHNGQGMAIYDSLQKREQFSVEQVEKTIDKVDCSFITLIDNKYCENLKTIYKPPFGIYCYGNYSLVNQNTLTIFANPKENENEIKQLNGNGFKLLGVKPSAKEMKEILKTNPKDNIFYISEINNKNKDYQNLLINQDIIFDNAFVSEIWEKAKDKDYSNQQEIRMYLGLTKKVLILEKLSNKQLLEIANYAKNEDILVVFSEKAINQKDIKLFQNAKIKVIKENESILTPFEIKK